MGAGNGKVTNSQHVDVLLPQKLPFIGYILWLCGGLFGSHHIYYWWCSLCGWLTWANIRYTWLRSR